MTNCTIQCFCWSGDGFEDPTNYQNAIRRQDTALHRTYVILVMTIPFLLNWPIICCVDRLRTIISYDRILVMDAGNVAVWYLTLFMLHLPDNRDPYRNSTRHSTSSATPTGSSGPCATEATFLSTISRKPEVVMRCHRWVHWDYWSTRCRIDLVGYRAKHAFRETRTRDKARRKEG